MLVDSALEEARLLGLQPGMASGGFLRIFRVLLGSSDHELRRQIQFLKAENEVLRTKVAGPVRVTPQEKSRLIRLARPLGDAIKELVSIVQPATMLRWIRESKKSAARGGSGRARGRPRTAEDVQRLILKMARETGWGYTRIRGELKKLGITVSRGTVVNILKQAGLPTSPQRGERTWGEFMKSHAETLWACDFVQQRVLTFKGLRDAYFMVFINTTTRRVVATPSTLHPTAEWVAEQVELVAPAMCVGRRRCKVIMRDRDRKFGEPFDGALRAHRITPVQLPHCSPNLNAHVERFIQTLRRECLDKFIVLGTDHLDHLVEEFVEHYNTERPHSSLDSQTPAEARPSRRSRQRQEASRLTRAGPEQPTPLSPIRCCTRLGGTLRHYYRAA